MPVFEQINEIGPGLAVTNRSGVELDISGFSQCKIVLQLGRPDEFTLEFPARNSEDRWRSDMPVWQTGGGIIAKAGYNGALDLLQKFEIVSTTNAYDGDDGGETAVVRGASDLIRAYKSKKARVFDFAKGKQGSPGSGNDAQIIDAICSDFGWTNGVTADLDNPPKRSKENGKPDTDLLMDIASDALIGAPRLSRDDVLEMPEPTLGTLKYARGQSPSGGVWRRLHSLESNRESGSTTPRVAVLAWDPKTKTFIQTEFEADEFGGDPRIVFEGPASVSELTKDASTTGLTLAVINHRGQTTKDNIDILSLGRYFNESDAISLARRWFILREKLSRWSDITVDGHRDLVPYKSIELGGNLAAVDRGVWLPIKVTHRFDNSGWMTTCRSIRVVDEVVIHGA